MVNITKLHFKKSYWKKVNGVFITDKGDQIGHQSRTELKALSVHPAKKYKSDFQKLAWLAEPQGGAGAVSGVSPGPDRQSQ